MGYKNRNIADELIEVLSFSRAAALLGPRQAGKSTLARKLQWGDRTPGYYTLDDEALRESAVEDAMGFVLSIDRPAVIDEVQRAPGLMLALKQVLDEDPSPPGQFLLTGSANLLAHRKIVDALPGRVQYVNLWPLSQGEIEGTKEAVIDSLLRGEVPKIVNADKGRSAHAHRIVQGGFPEALDLPERRLAGFFSSYVRGIVGRDLLDLSGVHTDPAKIEQLFRLMASRTSGSVNLSRLGRELGLDDTTVKAHLDLLEQMFQVVQLRPWSSNLGSRHVKSSKYFLADSGLASALIGVDAARYSAIDQGEIAGMLLETFVVGELVRQQTWSEQRVNLYFYRDNRDREVDVVIESVSGHVVGVEVKAAATVVPGHAKGLRFLRDKLGDRFKAGVVFYSGEHTVQIEERIFGVPLEGLWSAGRGAPIRSAKPGR